MVDAVEQQEEDIGSQEENTVIDDGRIVCEQSNRSRCEDINESGDDTGDGQCEHIGCDGSLLGTFQLPRTHVLGNECGGCHGHGIHRQHDKHIELVIAAPARHDTGTEVVDIALYKDIGEGCQHRLDGCRHTHAEDPFQNIEVNAHVFECEAVDILCAD